MKLLKAVLKVLLGLGLGLGAAEVVFSLRDDGAFPHVNFYVEDAQRGTRLAPNASMKLKVGGNNPVTTVATNSFGYRAPEWPAPTEGEVLVVGDSQVFGLGVEASETFSSQLATLLKVPVLNGGVPTYGPREYTAVVRDVLETRKTVRTVVYVLNLSNDLFEADRPNVERHKVWDGWAVRTETAPRESPTAFPFRRELMSKSHLVYGLRKFLASTEPAPEAFATEGTWKDVVKAGADTKPLPPEDEGARKLLRERSELAKDLDRVAQDLEDLLADKVERDQYLDELKPFAGKNGDPRDIISDRFAEGGREINVTAYHLFMAAVGQARSDKLLADIAAKKKDPKLAALVEQRKQLRAKLLALKPEGEPEHTLPLDRVLLETQQLADAAGAKLLVVALPLDVMVSAEEWKKYKVEPLDMSATKVLTEELVTRAERLGALGLDATPALAAAEPGAFLDADLHMTPKGHEALAKAIAAALQAKPKPKSALTLPEGRSWPPAPDEFRSVEECTVKGSTAANCETRMVREWLRVICTANYEEGFYGQLEGMQVVKGGHGDAYAYVRYSDNELLIPVLEGDAVEVKYWWERKESVLRLDWPKGGTLTMAFDKPSERSSTKPDKKWTHWEPLKFGVEPTCPPGQKPAGALLQCAETCDETHACQAGHCEPWPSGGFCAVP